MNFHSPNSIKTQRFGRNAVILRARGNEPLSDQQIAESCPSVFATDKHASRSERFTYIPTNQLLTKLREHGFEPFEVRQGGSRDEDKRGFTKHMIRMRHASVPMYDGHFREVIALNAHDGTSAIQFLDGVFRTLCTNGIIAGNFDQIRIRHTGDIIPEVIDAAYTVIDRGREIESTVNTMRQITLSKPEQEIFAEEAATLRFDDEQLKEVAAVRLNDPNRQADTSNDLWTTFNRVQENLIRGGVGYRHRNERGEITYRHTRPVRSIDGDVKLNRALFQLASRMAELKG